MNYDEAIAWVGQRRASVPAEARVHEDGRAYVAALGEIRNLLYAGRANLQVVETLAPLCPCSLGPDTEGPEQECPIHGDGQTFVALCRWRDAVVGAATSVRLLADVSTVANSSWQRLCELLDGGPFSEPAPQDAMPRDARLEPF